MIERLKNCPNCAGILNEAGRCTYCGSKVYDFLSINFSSREMPSDNTYIRIKVEDRIILAPIVVNTASLTTEMNPCYADFCDGGKYLVRNTPTTSIDLSLLVVGDIYQMCEEGGEEE